MPTSSSSPHSDSSGAAANAQAPIVAPARWEELGVNPDSISPDVRAAIAGLEQGRHGQPLDDATIGAAQRALAHEALAIQALERAGRRLGQEVGATPPTTASDAQG